MRKKYIAAGLAGLMLVSSLIMNVNADETTTAAGGQVGTESIPTRDGTTESTQEQNGARWYEHVFDTTAISVEAETETQNADVYGYIGNYNKDKAEEKQGYFDIHGDQKTATAYVGDDDPKSADMVLSDPKFINISVPSEMFLLIVGTESKTDNIKNVYFLSPDYTITNNSGGKVTVSITGFENKKDDLTDKSFAENEIVLDSNLSTYTDKKFSLYIKPSSDEKYKDNNQFITSFAATELLTTNDKSLVLGSLKSNESGVFEFTGNASDGMFVEDNVDEEYPVSVTEEILNNWVKKHARAKYKMIYKFDLDKSAS